MTITAQEILAQRLYNQALLESKLTGTEVLAKSLGIQSQYVTHGIYNYFNRLANPKADSYADLTEQGILAWGSGGPTTSMIVRLGRPCHCSCRRRSLGPGIIWPNKG